MKIIMIKFLICIGLYFTKVKSNFGDWETNERQGIKKIKNCLFVQKNELIAKFADDTEVKCDQTCIRKFPNCTHYFWLNGDCLIKSGYISKNNVIKTIRNDQSECGIVPERIRKYFL